MTTADSTKTLHLVPARDCGTCFVCCKELTIQEPELKKPPGMLCRHCVETKGCGIYETRPQVCRSWFCGWRQMQNLDDDWRPDRCEILITAATDHIPPGYAPEGLTLELIGSRERVTWPPFLQLVRALIENNLPAFLSVRGAPGYTSGNIFLNDKLAGPLAANDQRRVMQILFAAVEACVALPKIRIPLDRPA
jgi:hypothetical protein